MQHLADMVAEAELFQQFVVALLDRLAADDRALIRLFDRVFRLEREHGLRVALDKGLIPPFALRRQWREHFRIGDGFLLRESRPCKAERGARQGDTKHVFMASSRNLDNTVLERKL